MDEDEDAAPDDGTVNPRMCIVSRRSLPAEALIRFVVAPDGEVVPDLRRRLPGRGAHVEARREVVALAVRRNLFRRAFKGEGRASDGLADGVDALMAKSALGALGLARKAGQVAMGAAKVEAELRAGRAVALLQASDGAADGRRKMYGARHAAMASGRGEDIPVFTLFEAEELGLALGGANVVHAAVLAGSAGAALLSRLRLLQTYRGETPSDEHLSGSPSGPGLPAIEGIDGSGGGDAPRGAEAFGKAAGQEAEV